MDYRFDLHKTNFLIVISLFTFDCVLHSAENNGLPLRRERSEQSEPAIGRLKSSETAFGSCSPEISPEPMRPDNASDTEMSAYSMVGNKSFVPSSDFHARGLYNQLLKDQSNEILSDFCRIAGIRIDDLSRMVSDFQNQFPGAQDYSSRTTCSIKKFFSDHGYGHQTITIKQGAGWGGQVAFTSCKGLTIYPAFSGLDLNSQQAVLHRELQHFIYNDSFYRQAMFQIAEESRNPKAQRKLQAILSQYDKFIRRRADLKAGIYGGDAVVDSLVHQSRHALELPLNCQPPVDCMDELLRMIEQEKKVPVIVAWQKECAKACADRRVTFSNIRVDSFSESDDDHWADAEEFNNRLRFTGVDF
ncbi:MAG: hypothetical protein NTZ68_02955 [Candidatus Dependentiae bacterium]|nr:hypothetical protein [Candidatus Dependentiae bacterium]